MSTIQAPINFMFVFDIAMGNPNGDPNMNNRPRQLLDSGLGFMTDVSLKRKIRNYVEHAAPEKGIYFSQGVSLESKHKHAYDSLKLAAGEESEEDDSEEEKSTKKTKKSKVDKDAEEKARRFMCENYFDIRTFGAVLNVTKFRFGQVMGPVQLTFAKSLHPINPTDLTITRVCRTSEEATEKQGGSSEMGSKWIVPYGLYVGKGFISPPFAREVDKGGTGFSEEDVELLMEALVNMFKYDKSASRPEMIMRQVYVWRHSSPLGNYNYDKLFSEVESKIVLSSEIPQSFSDYTIPSINDLQQHDGVTLKTLI